MSSRTAVAVTRKQDGRGSKRELRRDVVRIVMFEVVDQAIIFSVRVKVLVEPPGVLYHQPSITCPVQFMADRLLAGLAPSRLTRRPQFMRSDDCVSVACNEQLLLITHDE